MSQGNAPQFVHVVFKTHLDMGFTALARDVVAAYFERFIPQALALARRTRETGGDRFVWTTGSWLIYEYLEHAEGSHRKSMEDGIAAGDIRWHALPFTTHTELMDAALFRHGLSLSRKLDERFGRKTTAAKMTDVPGHTRGMVPYLSEAGVEFLHLGVNPASMPPEVPPVFVWRHLDGTEAIVMYDKGGYGGTMDLTGTGEALAFGHTNDNLGPQREEDVAAFYAGVRDKMPGARVEATSLDAVGASLAKVRDQLPVVDEEMGDTWIHGVGSDPTKIRRYLELRRWYATQADDVRLERFADKLMIVPEHTWGVDVKGFLTDGAAEFELDAFRAERASGRFAVQEESWQEQRAYLDQAVAALLSDAPKPPPAAAVLSPEAPKGSMNRIENDAMRIDFGPDWRPSRVVDKRTGEERPLADRGVVVYETFGSEQFDEFEKAYNPRFEETHFWSVPDFCKPGLEKALRRGERTELRPISGSCDGSRALARLRGEGVGCPRDLWVEWRLKGESIIVSVGWTDKPASRIPEAIWLRFGFASESDEGFTLVKLGQPIDPTKVVSHGARRLHAVEAVRGAGYEIRPFDSPLVSVGGPGLLKFDDAEPRPSQGLAWNLFNNVWGTNFPIWFGEPAIFRFEASFERRPSGTE